MPTSKRNDQATRPKRIVSAPRSKVPTTPVSIRLPVTRRDELKVIAASQHLSLSDLIVEAIDRYVVECRSVSNAEIGGPVSGNTAPEVMTSLVDLSNVLVALAFATEQALGARPTKRREEAARIVCDAQERLGHLRKRLGC